MTRFKRHKKVSIFGVSGLGNEGFDTPVYSLSVESQNKSISSSWTLHTENIASEGAINGKAVYKQRFGNESTQHIAEVELTSVILLIYGGHLSKAGLLSNSIQLLSIPHEI